MRVPTMSTRRWMVAVAALAIAFGAMVWARRLKHRRDEYFAMASRHAGEEVYYRKLVADSSKVPFRRKPPEPSPEDSPKTITLPLQTIERWLGLPETDPTPTPENDRFKAAQARHGEMSARAQVIWQKYLQRQAAYNRRRADYHGALKRKYAASAARPWLSVAPDPPMPN